MYDSMVLRIDKLLAENKYYANTILCLKNSLDGTCNISFLWKDAKMELPDENVRVLVACQTRKGFRSHNLAYYADGHWHGTGSMSGVTHWAELPVLPIE